MQLSFEVREDFKAQKIVMDVHMVPKSGGRENVVPTPLTVEQAEKLAQDLTESVKRFREETSLRS